MNSIWNLLAYSELLDLLIHQELNVIGYETSKLFTSDTNLERGNAQRERRKIATTC